MSVWKQLGKPRKLPVMLTDFRANSMSTEYETLCWAVGFRQSVALLRIPLEVLKFKWGTHVQLLSVTVVTITWPFRSVLMYGSSCLNTRTAPWATMLNVSRMLTLECSSYGMCVSKWPLCVPGTLLQIYNFLLIIDQKQFIMHNYIYLSSPIFLVLPTNCPHTECLQSSITLVQI